MINPSKEESEKGKHVCGEIYCKNEEAHELVVVPYECIALIPNLSIFSASLLEQSFIDPAAQFLSLQEELCDDVSLISTKQQSHEFYNSVFEDSHADVGHIHCFDNEEKRVV